MGERCLLWRWRSGQDSHLAASLPELYKNVGEKWRFSAVFPLQLKEVLALDGLVLLKCNSQQNYFVIRRKVKNRG
jgi:hypothetical protein